MSQWGDLRGERYLPPSTSKDVLVLGAGASADEDLAVQQDLLGDVADFSRNAQPDHAWVDGVRLRASWDDVERYLMTVFPGTDLAAIRLEDCMTLFDIAVQRGEVVAGKGPRELDRLGQAFAYCLLSYFRSRTEGATNYNTPMSQLANFLAEKASAARDSHSIISFNWDISLDRSLYRAATSSDWPVVDYCTYTVPWRNPDETGGRPEDIPSLWKRPLNIPSVKLLKPHGSLNWLWCPTCDRLAVSRDSVIGWHGAARGGDTDKNERIEQGRYCPRCLRGRAREDTPLLREVVVTPTMVKNLEMTHLRMVWHNAFRELSEATNIIIVGYSVPDADFEFRYLLLKALAANPNDPKVRIIGRAQKPKNEVEEAVQERLNQKQEDWYRSTIGRSRLNNPKEPVERVGVKKFIESYTH